MKRKITFLLSAVVMLLSMFAMPNIAMAADGDTHDFSQSLSVLLNNNATISSINIAAQSYPIKKVTVVGSYNKNISNAVTIQVTVGGESWGTNNVGSDGSFSIDFEHASAAGATVVSFTNNTGSGTGHGTFKVTKITLTEGASSGPYNVFYNANGGTGTMTDSDSPYASGSTVNVLDNTFERTGYSFTSWNTAENGSGTTYYGASSASTPKSFTISNHTTLYAQWTVHTHNVTMPSNDKYGEYSASATSSVAYGTTVNLTYTPAAGYTTGYEAVWSVNGTPIAGNSFSMPDENVTVTVVVLPTVTWNLATASYSSAVDTLVTWSSTNVTMKLAKRKSSTNANNYLGGGGNNHTRCYQNQVLVFSPASGKAIDKIEITTTTAAYATNLAGYTWTNASASASSTKEVTVTPTNGGVDCSVKFNAACYLSSVKVIYGDLSQHTITFNGNGGLYGEEETYTQNVYHNVPAALTNNLFTYSGHGFTSWNTATNGSGTSYTNGQSVAFSANTTLYAQWATLRTATVYASISNGSVVIDDGGSGTSSVSVIPTTEITLIATPSDGFKFKEWNVYKYGDKDTKVTVTDNKFNMPDYNVIIDAVFHNKYTITFSVNGNTTVVDPVYVTIDDDVDLSDITATLTGFTFTGWSETEGGAIVDNPYTPTDNVTLYAVFSYTGTLGMYIYKDTENFPDEYGDAADYVLNGKTFNITQAYVNGTKLQWHKGDGCMYNKSSLGTISSIVLDYNNSDSNKNFTILAGTSANPTSGIEITPSSSSNIYTFDFSGGTYSHFVMTNGNGAGYLNSITINYSGTSSVTFTDISTSVTRPTPIFANEVVTVENGAVLTLNATNNGTAANLIIEDGGQLIHTNAVNATLHKEVTGYGANPEVTTGWYTIASPVADLSASTVATTEDYDLFAYQESNFTWLNTLNNTLTFAEGQGFLYANSANQTLSYAGSMKDTNAEVSIDLSYTAGAGALAGYNLVGNPFSRNLTSGEVKVGGSAITTYYVSEGGSNLTPRAIADYPIKPGQGFFVQATGAGQQIVFNPSSKDYASTKPAYITIEAGNSNFTDRSYVQLGGGNTLRKMSVNDNVHSLYVMQDGKDYASAIIESYNGSIPVCFKATETGRYTINVQTTGIDADYLHLIDRYTGADVDLLSEPSYTFIATKDDYESRFTLVFTADGSDTNNDIFAYQSGSAIIVNGNGELQIFDVTGRRVMTTTINGMESINIPNQGVYIFKLNEKVQKIVVR